MKHWIYTLKHRTHTLFTNEHFKVIVDERYKFQPEAEILGIFSIGVAPKQPAMSNVMGPQWYFYGITGSSIMPIAAIFLDPI